MRDISEDLMNNKDIPRDLGQLIQKTVTSLDTLNGPTKINPQDINKENDDLKRPTTKSQSFSVEHKHSLDIALSYIKKNNIIKKELLRIFEKFNPSIYDQLNKQINKITIMEMLIDFFNVLSMDKISIFLDIVKDYNANIKKDEYLEGIMKRTSGNNG